MPNSQNIETFLSDGRSLPGGTSFEIFEPDDEGDVEIIVWSKGKDMLTTWLSQTSAREIAIALLKAAQ